MELSEQEIKQNPLDRIADAYNQKENKITAKVLRYLEKAMLLQI